MPKNTKTKDLQKVTLKNKRGNKSEFEFEHALALLRLQQNKSENKKGWVIADENYTFENGEIIKKPSTK